MLRHDKILNEVESSRQNSLSKSMGSSMESIKDLIFEDLYYNITNIMKKYNFEVDGETHKKGLNQNDNSKNTNKKNTNKDNVLLNENEKQEINNQIPKFYSKSCHNTYYNNELDVRAEILFYFKLG